jgi:condensin complex subunit 2
MGFRSVGEGRQANSGRQHDLSSNGEIDEAFWASHKSNADQIGAVESAATGAYDANFFADDDGLAFSHGLSLGDDDGAEDLPFADAREVFSPPVDQDTPPSTSAGETGGLSVITALLNSTNTPGAALCRTGFGSQLVTQGGRRLRPEYVAYARVAKKVDVRRLKEEMWKRMGDKLISTSFNSLSLSAAEIVPPSILETEAAGNSPVMTSLEVANPRTDDRGELADHLCFTSVMNGLNSVYPEQAMRDISTSYCFICLLHLANEKGLVLQSRNKEGSEWEGGLEEVYIAKDIGVVIDGDP